MTKKTGEMLVGLAPPYPKAAAEVLVCKKRNTNGSYGATARRKRKQTGK